jgi:hypothetical protein
MICANVTKPQLPKFFKIPFRLPARQWEECWGWVDTTLVQLTMLLPGFSSSSPCIRN